jgi:hypothetical protein
LVVDDKRLNEKHMMEVHFQVGLRTDLDPDLTRADQDEGVDFW